MLAYSIEPRGEGKRRTKPRIHTRRVKNVPHIAASQQQNRGIFALGEISGQGDGGRVAHSVELRYTTGHGRVEHREELLLGLSGALQDWALGEESARKREDGNLGCTICKYGTGSDGRERDTLGPTTGTNNLPSIPAAV